MEKQTNTYLDQRDGWTGVWETRACIEDNG